MFNTALTSRILDQWEIAVGGATEYKEIEIYKAPDLFLQDAFNSKHLYWIVQTNLNPFQNLGLFYKPTLLHSVSCLSHNLTAEAFSLACEKLNEKHLSGAVSLAHVGLLAGDRG